MKSLLKITFPIIFILLGFIVFQWQFRKRLNDSKNVITSTQFMARESSHAPNLRLEALHSITDDSPEFVPITFQTVNNSVDSQLGDDSNLKANADKSPRGSETKLNEGDYSQTPYHTGIPARLNSLKKVIAKHQMQLNEINKEKDFVHQKMRTYLSTLIDLEKQLLNALESGDVALIEEADKEMVSHVAQRFPGGATKANCNCCGIENFKTAFE